jgi:Cu/Ag efflux protein CusF
MKIVITAAIGIWLAFVLVFTSLVGAQQGATPPAKSPGKAPAAAQVEVSGKIKSVDPAGKTVLLEDGTRLVIPDSVTTSPGALKAGATVKATVAEKGGQKVVTAIQVN